ncbi:DUF4331 domain-containing protein [Fibrella sp. HMF5335]|uniref:DUF4331 domain-containing protein n=1 Tax=Fibrella rubiginis TaxID=2817060 RepID=A0A939GGN4_9BACT|nr:DUF4331 domain-containing protein [Fibrella rubiginis]MBO0938659.1 DUF4331 domain-containing protein [Fibrella rubiginis]
MNRLLYLMAVVAIGCLRPSTTLASSHREAPLISNDPLADNTDVYAFKSPVNAENIVLIANYIPFEHPAGGPNWYTFGENIRYEIHVDNNTATKGDDIIYRFTFTTTNQDPTTFFNIRLGKQNQKTTYTCERSTNGGNTFTAIISNGVVPANNIGPRSIENKTVGLGAASYDALAQQAITTASTGEKIFCGPSDDPFFVDLGGAFDVGGFRSAATARDGLAKYNCHSIVIEVPTATLQKSGKTVAQAANILDADYVIGVWASASRPAITTLSTDGTASLVSGNWIQVSRLGMPLVNEAIIPIGMKDKWNASYPYDDVQFAQYFSNPELALYMDDSQFGGAVPGLSALRVQTNSLGSFDFRNTKSGLFSLKGTSGVTGTALDDAVFGTILLPNATSPRAVDILPIFYTGVPNLRPYQLATGKNGNPLAAGKPFINNFLPTLGDMLRLNMAVPATPRNDPKFSSLGIVQAAVLGLTDPLYNGSTTLQMIPNMDGFPNGRRLEDDVTTIELQAVGGVALAAIGLFYDDYTSASPSPVTPKLVSTLTFNGGVTKNDTTFKANFPYLQSPWRGFNGPGYEGPSVITAVEPTILKAPEAVMVAGPNPFQSSVSLRYKLTIDGNVVIKLVGGNGRQIDLLDQGYQTAGSYTVHWNGSYLAPQLCLATLSVNDKPYTTVKLLKH